MSADYPVMLAAVVIDSTNGGLRITEGANTSVTSIPAGTYFLRGDGVADDLLLAIKTAMETNTAPRVSVNTYTVAVAWSTSPAAPSAVITITRATGADTFGVLWADALTTFDQALVGFVASDTVNASAKTSTLSPSCVWVSPEIYVEAEEDEEDDAYVQRARSGVVRGGDRGGPYETLRISFQLMEERRVKAARIAADVARAFDRFRRQLVRGRQFELHFGTISSGTTLAALSSSTERGAGWHLSPDSVDGFRAERLRPGLPLYAWSLELWAHV